MFSKVLYLHISETNIPTVLVLPGQFRLLVFRPGIPDSIKLSRLLDLSPKNLYSHNFFISSGKTYTNKWFFHCLNLSFRVIHSLNSINNITSLSSTKMLFCIWKDVHSIRLLTETFFRTVFFSENIKIESKSRFLKYYIRVYRRQ